MTTRVIGRGMCPRCGEEGSIVLKDMYNKVYIYVKHGRRWCYVGPLEAVDLSSIITSLSDYHYLTTKIRSCARITLGLGRMRVSTLVFVSLFSVAIAYTASASYRYPYEVRVATELLSQFSTVIAVLTALLAVATYEVKYKKRLELRIPFVTANPALGVILTALATLAGVVVFLPLRSHVEPYYVSILIEVREFHVFHYVSMEFSISCILLIALVLAVTSRGLFSKPKWTLLALFASPVLALAILFSATLALDGKFTSIAVQSVLSRSVYLGAIIAFLALLYLAGTAVFKKLLLLEQ